MKALVTLLLWGAALLTVQAQEIADTKIVYYSWIYLNNDQGVLKGTIVETKDSSLLYIPKALLLRNAALTSITPQTVPVASISKINYRKRNSVTRGGLLGSLAGAALGAAIGYAGGDDHCSPTGGLFDCMFTYTAQEKAGMGAVLGIIPGMSLGILLGSSRKKVYINGDQKVYSLSRDELKAYTLTKR